MKKLLILTFLCLSAFTAPKDIVCQDIDCTYDVDLNISNTGGTGSFTSFKISPNAEDVNLYTPAGQTPRSARFHIQNKSLAGQDVNVSLTSTTSDNAGSVLIVGDIIDILNIDTSGADGIAGLDSSQVCAQNFTSGVYGVDAQTYFATTRGADPLLPTDRCTAEDVTYADNMFSCPSGYTERASDNVTVETLNYMRKCQGVVQTTRCVKRTIDVQCKLNYVMPGCCNSGPYTMEQYRSQGIPFYIAPLNANYTCDSLKCTNPIGLNGYKSGHIQDLPLSRVDEYLTISKSESEVCEDIRAAEKGSNTYVGYSTQVLIDPGDPAKGYTAGPDVFEVNAPYGPSYTGNSYDAGRNTFEIPLPDVMDIQNNTDASNLTNFRIAVDLTKSSLNFTNCLGLGGSSHDDRFCDRVGSGGATSIYLRYSDEFGNLSNELKVNVPQGRYRYRRLYAANRDIYCDQDYPNRWNYRTANGYTYGRVKTGNTQLECENDTWDWLNGPGSAAGGNWTDAGNQVLWSYLTSSCTEYAGTWRALEEVIPAQKYFYSNSPVSGYKEVHNISTYGKFNYCPLGSNEIDYY